MSQSDTGRFLITLTYLNTQLIRDRLAEEQRPEHRAYVQSLYDEYQPVVTDVMTNPSSTRVLTQEDGMAYQQLCLALEQSGVITSQECSIALSLANMHTGMLGMNRAQVIDYMNTTYCLDSVRNAAMAMDSVQLWGEARTFDLR
jgi:hypothetical protein